MADDTLDTSEYDKIAQQWTSFLDQPGGRAALLQAGLALSQPMAWGQSGFGHLAGAIGSGAEAATRAEALGLKAQEAESRMMLAEARAGAAGAHAGAAETRAQSAREKLESGEKLKNLQARIQVNRMYNQYRAGEENNYQKALREYETNKLLYPNKPPPERPQIMSEDEFIRSSPVLRELGITGPSGTLGGQPIGGGRSGLSPQDQQALDWANSNPGDPRAAQIKQRLGM
jgi:hypothetical protein